MGMSTKTTAVLLAAAALVGAGCGSDDGDSADSVKVADPWVRVTAPGQEAGAAYMKITAKEADELVSATVSSDVAGSAELHETVAAGKDMEHSGNEMSHDHGAEDAMSGSMDAMAMRAVKSIVLPAAKEVVMKPGGYHVMLMKLKKPVKAGDEIELTLKFKNSDPLKVTAVARES